MSYPRSLDEYSDKELIIELAKRCAERYLGNCDYCRRPRTEPAKCGSGRHNQDEHHLRKLLKEFGVTDE